MKCKCSACDFIFIFDNTPENNVENNRISCEHINSHKDLGIHIFWIDLETPNPNPSLNLENYPFSNEVEKS